MFFIIDTRIILKCPTRPSPEVKLERYVLDQDYVMGSFNFCFIILVFHGMFCVAKNLETIKTSSLILCHNQLKGLFEKPTKSKASSAVNSRKRTHLRQCLEV